MKPIIFLATFLFFLSTSHALKIVDGEVKFENGNRRLEDYILAEEEYLLRHGSKYNPECTKKSLQELNGASVLIQRIGELYPQVQTLNDARALEGLLEELEYFYVDYEHMRESHCPEVED